MLKVTPSSLHEVPSTTEWEGTKVTESVPSVALFLLRMTCISSFKPPTFYIPLSPVLGRIHSSMMDLSLRCNNHINGYCRKELRHEAFVTTCS